MIPCLNYWGLWWGWGVGRWGNLLSDSLNYFRGGDLEVLKCVNIWARSGYIEMRSTEPLAGEGWKV